MAQKGINNGPEIVEKNSQSCDYKIRKATERDIPQLSIHHSEMFKEIWKNKGKSQGDSESFELGNAYSQKLNRELGNLCRCWVIETGRELVASGALTIVSFVPIPDDSSSRVGYLHSMYTDKRYRGRGFANLIVKAALQYCRENGIKRVVLNASEAGRPIYEKIGFISSPETMKIFLE